MRILDDPNLDWTLLERYRFRPELFSHQVMQWSQSGTSISDSMVRGRIEPALVPLHLEGAVDQSAQAYVEGQEALRRGEVAVLVVNGGMATRFGRDAKGTVEVYDRLSFIALKCRDVLRVGQRVRRVPPLVLMNSFATHDATVAHCHEHSNFGLDDCSLLMFNQTISIRLTPSGELFIGADGGPSYYSPGHGDVFEGLCTSQVLSKLRDRGIKHLAFSNVDNLGATLDPCIIGLHRRLNSDMTVEVVERLRDADGKWEAGGAAVFVNGRMCVVEGFRLPSGIEWRLPHFQTNNMLFKLDALDQDIELARYPVIKRVDGKEALQFESIICEASSACDASGRPLLKLGLIRVPRNGPRGRFFPIKTPADLALRRTQIRNRLECGN